MKRGLTRVAVLLLSVCASVHCEGTAAPFNILQPATGAVNNPIHIMPPPIIKHGPTFSPDTTKQRAFLTQCHGIEAITGHDGKIAHFKTHCHVEVWNGADQPVFPDLQGAPDLTIKSAQVHPEHKPHAAGVAAGHHAHPHLAGHNEHPHLAGHQEHLHPASHHPLHPVDHHPLHPVDHHPLHPGTGHPTVESIMMTPEMQALKKEAEAQHHRCMETKHSMIEQLRMHLPPSLHDSKDVLAAISGADGHTHVQLAPHVGLYIGHLDQPMKEKLAQIHAAHHAPGLSEADRLAALKHHYTELRQHTDRHCQGSHPTIRHHGIGYFPSSDVSKLHMSLVIRQPGNHIQFMHLPEHVAYDHHIGYLQAMAEAAAQHASALPSLPASFDVYHHPLPTPDEELALRRLTLADQPSLFHHLEIPRLIVVKDAHHGEEKPTADGAVDIAAAMAMAAGQEKATKTSQAIPLPQPPAPGAVIRDGATLVPTRNELEEITPSDVTPTQTEENIPIPQPEFPSQEPVDRTAQIHQPVLVAAPAKVIPPVETKPEKSRISNIIASLLGTKPLTPEENVIISRYLSAKAPLKTSRDASIALARKTYPVYSSQRDHEISTAHEKYQTEKSKLKEIQDRDLKALQDGKNASDQLKPVQAIEVQPRS